MSFPRYDEYKDSGVEWLGEVPAHWDVDRFKRSVASSQNGIWGTDPQDDENDLPCVRVADFDRIKLVVKDEIPTIRNVTPRERENRVLARGNLVLEKSGGGERQLVGCVVLYDSDMPAVCSNFVARVELKLDMAPTYWRYAHAAAYAVRLNYGSVKQTSGIQNLDQGAYFDERCMFPPLPEQTAIAAFLDRETAKIDDLVAEQRNLIALLKEKRQALISHAVTKGLDPSVPMKDSGVEWLGEVPVHWERVQLGRVCQQVSDGPHYSPSYVDEGVLFLSARNFSAEKWLLDDAKYVSEADYEEFCKRVIPEKMDVLYSKGGTTGVARVVDLDQRFQVWVHVAVLKLHSTVIDPYFLAYALNSHACYEQSQLLTRGATNQDLGLGRMVKIWFALPSLDEQRQISAWLDGETGDIDNLVTEAESTITLLQERRTALISAAVTGKIDVRGAVAQTEEAAA